MLMLPCVVFPRQNLVEVEAAVKRKLAEFKYTECFDTIVQARRVINSVVAEPYDCLKPLRGRLETALVGLRDSYDREFVGLAADPVFSPARYENLLRGLYLLDKEGIPQGDEWRSSEVDAVPSAAPVVPPVKRGGGGRLSTALEMSVKESDAASTERRGNLPTAAAKVQAGMLSAMKEKTKEAIIELIITLEDADEIEAETLSHVSLRRSASTTGAAAASAVSVDTGDVAGTGVGSKAGLPTPARQHSAASQGGASVVSGGASVGKPDFGLNVTPGLAASEAGATTAVNQLRVKRAEFLHLQRYPELCARVPEKHLVRAVSEVCSAIVQCLHVHYQIMQWHRCPLDGRNADIGFLHRCGIDSLETTPTATPQASDAELAKVLRNGIRSDMLATRRMIWHFAQQRVSILLRGVVSKQGPNLQVEYLAAALAVVSRFMEVGEEYSNADSATLANAVRLLCWTLVDTVSSDATETLLRSLKRESFEVRGCFQKGAFSLVSRVCDDCACLCSLCFPGPRQRMAVSNDTLNSMLAGLAAKSLRLSSLLIAQATAATGDDSKLRALQDSTSTVESDLMSAKPGELAGRMEIFPHLVPGGNMFAEMADAAFAEANSARAMALGRYDSEEDEPEVVDEEPDSGSDGDEMFGEPIDKAAMEGVTDVEDGFRCPFVVTSTCLNVFFKVTGARPTRVLQGCGRRDFRKRVH